MDVAARGDETQLSGRWTLLAAPWQVHREPGVLPNLGNGDSLERVHQQHAGDEVASPGRQVAGQVVNAALDLFEQVGNVLVVEGQAAAQQRVQDDAARPAEVKARPSDQV